MAFAKAIGDEMMEPSTLVIDGLVEMAKTRVVVRIWVTPSGEDVLFSLLAIHGKRNDDEIDILYRVHCRLTNTPTGFRDITGSCRFEYSEGLDDIRACLAGVIGSWEQLKRGWWTNKEVAVFRASEEDEFAPCNPHLLVLYGQLQALIANHLALCKDYPEVLETLFTRFNGFVARQLQAWEAMGL